MANTVFIELIDDKSGRAYVIDPRLKSVKEEIPFALEGGTEMKFAGRVKKQSECVLSLPLDMLGFKILELGLTDIDNVREVLAFELDGLVLGQPDDYVFDAVMLEHAGETRKVLAVYCDKARLAGLLNTLSNAGLDPYCVTSLDLGSALRHTSAEQDLAERLIAQPELSDTADRARLAVEELASVCTVNLRRGALSYEKESKRLKRSIMLAAFMISALCFIWAASFFVEARSYKKDITKVRESMLKSYAKLMPGDKSADVGSMAIKMKARLSELKDKSSSFGGESALNLMMKLQEIKTEEVEFAEVAMESGSITLKGTASSLSEIDKLKSAVGRFLKDVSISDTEQSASDRIEFAITAKEAGN